MALTGGSGQVEVPVNPATTGEMLITVWAHNHISYLGSIDVGGTGVKRAKGDLLRNLHRRSLPEPGGFQRLGSLLHGRAGTATVQVFDLTGRSVATLGNGEFPAGQHTLNWDLTGSGGAPVPSGFYSVVVNTGETVMTQRITVIR